MSRERPKTSTKRLILCGNLPVHRPSGEPLPCGLAGNAQCRSYIRPTYPTASERIDLRLNYAPGRLDCCNRGPKRTKELLIGHCFPTGKCRWGGVRDFVADANARIANVDFRSADKLADLFIPLPAKGATERTRAALQFEIHWAPECLSGLCRNLRQDPLDYSESGDSYKIPNVEISHPEHAKLGRLDRRIEGGGNRE